MGLNRIAAVLVVSSLFVIAGTDRDGLSNTLRVNNQTFAAEFATTDTARQKGLSDRPSIADDQAMVFVFHNPDTRCFWMKDMKFDIDIVWLDAAKRVNAVEQQVTPDTYPSSFCHVNAKYVVEFASGTVRQLGLRLGDTFQF